MRTKTQDKRLLKLIAFLNALPPKRFNFNLEVTKSIGNGHRCATVACAIGWTPAIFSRTVKWIWDEGDRFLKFKTRTHYEAGFKIVADELFGVPWAHDIFWPGGQYSAGLENLEGDATPQQVAAMLKAYRKAWK